MKGLSISRRDAKKHYILLLSDRVHILAQNLEWGLFVVYNLEVLQYRNTVKNILIKILKKVWRLLGIPCLVGCIIVLSNCTKRMQWLVISNKVNGNHMYQAWADSPRPQKSPTLQQSCTSEWYHLHFQKIYKSFNSSTSMKNFLDFFTNSMEVWSHTKLPLRLCLKAQK